MEVIKEVLGSYKETLENLTCEITSLREQLTDQKTEFKNQLKLINQQRKQHQQQIEHQIKEQQQHQIQQQHQVKNQLKQQIEQHMEIIKTTECTPKIDIQYEEITVPKNLQKQNQSIPLKITKSKTCPKIATN